MPDILAIDGNVDYRPLMVTWLPCRADFVHQLAVSGINGLTVHDCLDSVTRDVLYVCNTCFVHRAVICSAEGLRDGVVGVALRKRGDLKQIVL
jgi:hypothetical protein